MCQAEPEVVAELARGARLGVRECQFQFRFRRWNCSSHSKAFGRILQQGQCERGPGVQGRGGGLGRLPEPHLSHGSPGTLSRPCLPGPPSPYLTASPITAPQDSALVLPADCLSLPPQTSGRRPLCLLLLLQAPAMQSLRPAPWASCCSVAARRPEGGPHHDPRACQAPLGPLAPRAPQMAVLPGNGEAAVMTWISGMRSRGSLWTLGISGDVETSVCWCNFTTMRQDGW